MVISHKILLSSVLCLGLGACTIDEPAISALEKNSHPEVIDVKHAHRLSTSAGGQLTPLSIVEASEFVENIAPNFGDQIMIAGGRKKDHKMLMRLIAPNKAEIIQFPDPHKPMEIHITKAVIALEKCGQREDTEAVEQGQETPWNAGCANRNNLARMLDVPNDLRQGRPGPSTRPSDIEVFNIEALNTGNFEITVTTPGTQSSSSGGGEGGE